MRLQVSKFGTRLQGRIAGRKHYSKMCAALAEVHRGDVVHLDFTDVESANGSWLNAAIAPLVRWAAEPDNDCFLVLTNFPPESLDELELVSKFNAQCFLVANNSSQRRDSLRVIGPLDESLRIALEKLTELGTATGAELARRIPEARVKPTAWNNRLRDLYEKRLLQRRKEGRRQVYFPISQEVEVNG